MAYGVVDIPSAVNGAKGHHKTKTQVTQPVGNHQQPTPLASPFTQAPTHFGQARAELAMHTAQKGVRV